MTITFAWDKMECGVVGIDGEGEVTRFYVSDGTDFKVGVGIEELSDLLGFDLVGDLNSIDLKIFLPVFEMSHRNWIIISRALLLNSEVEEAFRGREKLQRLLRMNYFEICELPLVVYQARYDRGFVYLGHPVNFRAFGAPMDCFRNLFYEDDFVAVVNIHMKTLAVDMNSGFCDGHYIGSYL